MPISLDQINKYNNKKNIVSNNLKSSNFNNNITHIINLFNINKKNDINNDENNKIKSLYEKIEYLEDIIKSFDKNKKKYNSIDYNYSCVNLINNIPKNDDLVCWWCCHKFNNTPVYLPEKKYEDNYHVYGYFCSFNCALAYNLDKNDYKVG